MGEAAFENLKAPAGKAVDETRLASRVPTSVRDVVEDALAVTPGRTDTRQEVRAAMERLKNALVAHVDAAKESNTPHQAQATAAAGAPPTSRDSHRRSRAFRVMAGVRE
jgi:hypothetical protein